MTGILDRSLLRLIVNVYQTETLVIAVSPLEVVHDRPVHISHNLCAVLHGTMQFTEIAFHKVNALRVVYLSVQLYPVVA